MDKRGGWNGNEAGRDERQGHIDDNNWLTNPAEWDLCDEHETTFPMGGECPKCKAESESR